MVHCVVEIKQNSNSGLATQIASQFALTGHTTADKRLRYASPKLMLRINFFYPQNVAQIFEPPFGLTPKILSCLLRLTEKEQSKQNNENNETSHHPTDVKRNFPVNYSSLTEGAFPTVPSQHRGTPARNHWRHPSQRRPQQINVSSNL